MAVALLGLAAGVLLDLVTAHLPTRYRAPVGFGFFFVGALVASTWHRYLAVSWAGGLYAGLFVAGVFLQRRAHAADPVEADFRMAWDEPGREGSQETVDPHPEQVLDAVRALDGEDRTFVSVFRGPARLDVGGDAAGAMVVFQSADRRSWFQIRAPKTERELGPRDEVQVKVGQMLGHYPRRETTDLASALTAVSRFLHAGDRDPSLQWSADARRDEVVRPPSLQATD